MYIYIYIHVYIHMSLVWYLEGQTTVSLFLVDISLCSTDLPSRVLFSLGFMPSYLFLCIPFLDGDFPLQHPLFPAQNWGFPLLRRVVCSIAAWRIWCKEKALSEQGLVTVPIEHHPTIGDIISNRYGKVMWNLSPKRDIYQPLLNIWYLWKSTGESFSTG